MHTSIAPALSASFSVIAERFRRAGQMDRAVALCREGLETYPDHLSARVTLGCALLELGQHVEAHRELQAVLKRAPDNLAAIRGLAELHARGIDEQDAHDMQAAHDAQTRQEAESAQVAASEPAVVAEIGTTERLWAEAPERPLLSVLNALPVVEGFDPILEAEPIQFEIEDVIAGAEEPFDFGDALDASLDIDPPEEPPLITHAAQPLPVPVLSEGPIAVLDEWLTRIRARRSELLSEYAAS